MPRRTPGRTPSSRPGQLYAVEEPPSQKLHPLSRNRRLPCASSIAARGIRAGCPIEKPIPQSGTKKISQLAAESKINVHVEVIVMEACGGSHFLGRALREQGHEVRLIPAQYVKPYVKTNKSDYIDAEAIAEAVARPRMRFVPIKTVDQLDMESLHRVRERWVMRRTAVINQIRGLLLERGITLRKGRHHVHAALPLISEDADANGRPLGKLRVRKNRQVFTADGLCTFPSSN